METSGDSVDSEKNVKAQSKIRLLVESTDQDVFEDFRLSRKV